MMLIERQVTSLALSQRLAKLGVKQDSHFRWSEHTTPETLWCINALRDFESPAHYPTYAAFSTAELGEMLGQKPLPYRINIGWEWYVRDHVSKADTEAEARGFMLEYLITNGLLVV